MSSGRTLSPRDGQSSVAVARPVLLARVRSSAAKIAASLATPLVPGDYLDLINPLRSGADLRARIIARTRETARSATLTLRPSGAWQGHLPGQYVRIGVDIDGVRRWRAFSITSAATPGTASSPATGPTPRTAALAGDARDFTITVTMIDDGLVSAHLVTGDVVGSLIALDLSTLGANVIANVVRNVWSHTVIICGHFPEGVQTFETESIDGETRGEWYLRQLLGSANISGPRALHIMTGNLSHQIEHHLFPDLPSSRYHEIAPRIREIMARYGLTYVTGPMPVQVASVTKKIFRLALPNKDPHVSRPRQILRTLRGASKSRKLRRA
ncbi:fatty acid desaturase [Bowdeniella nasicola]|uniref:fatty acid desaturase n=1 Tax=Bowdeniella nasicola TaxID=208480 RepID=UPI0009F8161A|nr:fatty acid desaturase [Bowdeniella nasicola]